LEKLILVTEQDEEIGALEKMAVHEKGLCHRAFSVFIFRNNRQELLLQKRHEEKYHCGGLWTNTCCGHPRPGEEIVAAGERRLFEEMGLKKKLSHVGVFHYIAKFKNGLTENEVDHVLVGDYDDEAIQANETEVSEFRWLPINIVLDELQKKPDDYTPWFKQAMNLALK